MKIAFCTCVKIGLSCIEAIHEIGGEFHLFITLVDSKSRNKSGRVFLDNISKEKNVPLLKINHINDKEVLDALELHQIDWLFIIGWSQIASKEVILKPKLGSIGAHPTLLPIGRGRASIPWAILLGLEKTGVTFFILDEGVDTGLILGQHEIPLTAHETADGLYKKVNKTHELLIRSLWPSLINNSIKGKVQEEEKASYWEGRKPGDGRILVGKMTCQEVDRLVRATTRPYPGAYLALENGMKKIIWRGKTVFTPGAQKIDLLDGHYYILEYSIEE